MKTYRVEITQTIEVTLDEAKFDEAFMAEFRESFFDFDTLEEHAEHIAQLYARGLWEDSLGNRFIEGYGEAPDMGISARERGFEVYTTHKDERA